jgi:hypothetical protein
MFYYIKKSQFQLKKDTFTSKTNKDKITTLLPRQFILFETPSLLGTYEKKSKNSTSY